MGHRLWPCVRPYVCHTPVLYQKYQLDFGTEASAYHRLCYKRISYLNNNQDSSLWNFVPNSLCRKISQLHVDHSNCCRLMRTLSVINWRRSSVASLSHCMSVHLCVQHDGREIACGAGLSAATETRPFCWRLCQMHKPRTCGYDLLQFWQASCHSRRLINYVKLVMETRGNDPS